MITVMGPDGEKIMNMAERLKRKHPNRDWREWEECSRRMKGSKKDACTLIALEKMMEE